MWSGAEPRLRVGEPSNGCSGCKVPMLGGGLRLPMVCVSVAHKEGDHIPVFAWRHAAKIDARRMAEVANAGSLSCHRY